MMADVKNRYETVRTLLSGYQYTPAAAVVVAVDDHGGVYVEGTETSAINALILKQGINRVISDAAAAEVPNG